MSHNPAPRVVRELVLALVSAAIVASVAAPLLNVNPWSLS